MNPELQALIKSINQDELPADRAKFFAERAKHLAMVSGASSIEIERMLKEVTKAISFVATDWKYFMLLGKVYKLALDTTSAIFAYRQALKLDPGNSTAKRYLAELLVLRGKELMIQSSDGASHLKYFSARAIFDEALELNRDNVDVWVLKAVCHVHADQLAEAYSAVCKAIRPHKAMDAEVFILRAKILWARGLIEQGNADIRAAAALDPDHLEVVSFTARSYVKAEQMYKEALKSFAAGKYDDALSLVNHALFIAKEDIKLHILISKIQRMMGNLQLAYTAIMKAKEMFEKHSYSEGEFNIQLSTPSEITRQINLILNEMALNYVQGGDYDRAILLYNKIIKTEKSISQGLLDLDPKFFVNRGDCYRALSRLSDAINDYEFALQYTPDNWEIKTRLSLSHYLIATDLFNETDFSGCENSLTAAVVCNPKVAEYFALRGKARYYQGKYQEAYEDYKKCVQLDAGNEDIRMRLSQFEHDMDDHMVSAGGKVRSAKNGPAPHAPAIATKQSADRLGKGPAVGGTPLSGLAESGANTDAGWSAVPDDPPRVLPIKVTSNDVIEMMLNPRKARALPTIKLLNTTDTSSGHSGNRGGGSRANGGSGAGVRACSVTVSSLLRKKLKGKKLEEIGPEDLIWDDASPMPSLCVSADLSRARIASFDLAKKNDRLQRTFASDPAVVSKASTWGLMESAKDLARAHSLGIKQRAEEMGSAKRAPVKYNHSGKEAAAGIPVPSLIPQSAAPNRSATTGTIGNSSSGGGVRGHRGTLGKTAPSQLRKFTASPRQQRGSKTHRS